MLPYDFPVSRNTLIKVDLRAGIAPMSPGVQIPFRPFFGSMGIAPASGRQNSAPPGAHAGNLDNKELVAGSTLYIPVQYAGALFSVGDGHLTQGDGEVDLCGLESPLTGVFRLTVRTDMKLLWPRAETPTHVIAMGFHETLDEAARRATREMVEYLVTVRHMTPQDAYSLCSMAVDLHVTQVVDGVKGVHAMVPKALFK
jgi:acetamidase/formamidase